MPFEILRIFAAILGFFAFHIDRRGRKVARANLDSAFGDTISSERKESISCKSYQTFTRTILELFWSKRLTKFKLDQFVTVEGLDERVETGRSTIYVCAHSSNFELLSHALALHGRPCKVIAQKLKNPGIDQVLNRLRSTTGHQIIPQERSMAKMYRHLRSGGSFCMLVDLNLDPDEGSIIIDQFSGLKASVTQMHVALAIRTGANIVPAVCVPSAGGKYRMTFHQPILCSRDSNESATAQQCWKILENDIFQRPESWLWSYKHWRFKPLCESNARYPFYANFAKRFDRAIKNGKKNGPVTAS